MHLRKVSKYVSLRRPTWAETFFYHYFFIIVRGHYFQCIFIIELLTHQPNNILHVCVVCLENIVGKRQFESIHNLLSFDFCIVMKCLVDHRIYVINVVEFRKFWLNMVKNTYHFNHVQGQKTHRKL